MRLVLTFFTLLGLAFAPAPQPKTKTSRLICMAGYDYELPEWWDSVKVDVPAGLLTAKDVMDFVDERYGSCGTETTWRQALKTHAIAAKRLNYLPVFVAHCHMTGEEYVRAAKVYGDLYELAATEGKDRQWYESYLAYNAGLSYALADEPGKAKVWYARAAKYVCHEDDAIAYYAKQSVKALPALER